MISLKEYNVGDQVYCPRPTVVFTSLIDLNMAFAEFISKYIVYLLLSKLSIFDNIRSFFLLGDQALASSYAFDRCQWRESSPLEMMLKFHNFYWFCEIIYKECNKNCTRMWKYWRLKGNQVHKDLFEGNRPRLGQFPLTLWKFTC